MSKWRMATPAELTAAGLTVSPGVSVEVDGGDAEPTRTRTKSEANANPPGRWVRPARAKPAASPRPESPVTDPVAAIAAASIPTPVAPAPDAPVGTTVPTGNALMFADPADMFLTFNARISLHKWQIEEMMHFAGFLTPGEPPVQPTADAPLLINLAAANGSGKDMTYIAGCAAWFCATKYRSKFIITSSGYEQLKSQTFKHLRDYCEMINAELHEKFFVITEFLITCPRTGSYIKLFRSDDPSKVEGHHAEFDGEFAFLCNEAKSVSDPIHDACDRYTGWNRWIMVSSTGDVSGRFYTTSMAADNVWPSRPVPGKQYLRKITAFECPHLKRSAIERFGRLHGVHSALYKSKILSEFTAADQSVMIPADTVMYPAPARNTFSLPLKAGLDIALGGDETVLDIWHGNYRVARELIASPNATILHYRLIALFKRYNLAPENITADYGGIGRPIVQRLRENGWNIRTVNNESRAHNTADFFNRGTENWYKIKRWIEEKRLVLPLTRHGYDYNDDKLIAQLTTRRYSVDKGRIRLETKPDMAARGLGSPDRADALALVHCDLPIDFFGSESPEAAPAALTVETLLAANTAGQLTPDQYATLVSNFSSRATLFERQQQAENNEAATSQFDLLNI